jgi:hypothetical protein
LETRKEEKTTEPTEQGKKEKVETKTWDKQLIKEKNKELLVNEQFALSEILHKFWGIAPIAYVFADWVNKSQFLMLIEEAKGKSEIQFPKYRTKKERTKAKSENTQKDVNKVSADEGNTNCGNDLGDTQDKDQDKEDA